MTTCTKRWSDIPFAHRQPAHPGHCRLIHGHNWSFEFEFVAREKDSCGFVVDFGGLKDVKAWLDEFDHAVVLNSNDPALQMFRGMPELYRVVTVPDCSCEGLAELAFRVVDDLVMHLTDRRVTVARCTVWEDAKNSATRRAL